MNEESRALRATIELLEHQRDEWKRRWSEENDAMIAAQEECDVWKVRAEKAERLLDMACGDVMRLRALLAMKKVSE